MTTPRLATFMTRHPHSIRVDETVHHAQKMMEKLSVRHLPVLSAGEIVGVVSDRDLRLVRGDAHVVKVEDVCVDEPVTVDVDTSVFVVAGIMAERRVGSVLVTEDGKLAGIFTTTDACRTLAAALAPT